MSYIGNGAELQLWANWSIRAGRSLTLPRAGTHHNVHVDVIGDGLRYSETRLDNVDTISWQVPLKSDRPQLPRTGGAFAVPVICVSVSEEHSLFITNQTQQSKIGSCLHKSPMGIK